MAHIDFTQDTVFNGNVKLFQPKIGFRANVDSLLLAASVEAKPNEIGLDIGSGCGGTAIPLSYRLGETRLACIDKDKTSVTLGRVGTHANGLSSRLYFSHATIESYAQNMAGQFDFALTNPPYFAPGTICPPGVGKENAYLSHTHLTDWVRNSLHTLRHKGRLYLIHRAADLSNCLVALDGRAGEIMVRPVASFDGGPAKRIIIRARKGLRRGEVRLLAPIFLHEKDGSGPSQTLLGVRQGGAIDWC